MFCNFCGLCAGQERTTVGQKASPQIVACSLATRRATTAIATDAKSSPAPGQQHRGIWRLEFGPCAGFYLLHGSGQVRSLPQTTFVAGVCVILDMLSTGTQYVYLFLRLKIADVESFFCLWKKSSNVSSYGLQDFNWRLFFFRKTLRRKIVESLMEI